MIIFDEKIYAEKLLSNGFIRKNKKLKDVFILGKYYKYIGYSQLGACKSILKFISEYDNTLYSEIKENFKKCAINTINNVYLHNYTFRFDVKIDLYDEDLRVIAGLNTIGEKQILFALLVVSKFFNNPTNYFYIHYSDIFAMTKLDCQTNNIETIISKLIKDKHIEIISKYKMNNILNTYSAKLYERGYIKINVGQGENIVYTISEFNNLVGEFSKCMNLVDDDKYCSECGVEIEVSNNRQKYCTSCWKEIRDQQNRDKSLKYYHKNKNFTT